MPLFLTPYFFALSFLIAFISALGIWLPSLFQFARVAILCLIAATVIDAILLFFVKIKGTRLISQHLDLGEKNAINIDLKVLRGYVRKVTMVEKFPQYLILSHKEFRPDETITVFPTRRGSYLLGRSLAFVRVLGLLERRITLVKKGDRVEVYPAFSRLREKDQQARSLQILNSGLHKRQLPTNQTEFMDIREYVIGDDIRTINWKATARTSRLMVNNYEDERSQTIVNIIDCGRAMHRTFNNLTLQDYAINASLLLSYSALLTEGDNVGLSTYGPEGLKFLPPKPGERQLHTIIRQLYALETTYGEGDLEELCLLLDRKLQRRSLIILYTDYTTLEAMERQLPFLQRISRRHCLVVAQFIDKELENVSEGVFSVESTLASDLVLQKRLIADRLQRNNIHSLLTTPANLSFSVVSKYLELRKR